MQTNANEMDNNNANSSYTSFDKNNNISSVSKGSSVAYNNNDKINNNHTSDVNDSYSHKRYVNAYSRFTVNNSNSHAINYNNKVEDNSSTTINNDDDDDDDDDEDEKNNNNTSARGILID